MKSTIICVDDEQIVLKSLKTELKELLQNDFVIELAESGEEAITLLKDIQGNDGDVAVIITDYVMPGMNGYQLLDRIQGLSPATEKIMLTGRATTEGIIKTINVTQLFRFIAKPWDKAFLQATVNEAVHSYQQSRQLEQQRQMLLKKNLQFKQLLTDKDSLATELTNSNALLTKEIAEHKQARVQLVLLKNYMRNIIDSMPSVLIGVDVDGRVTQWNQEAQKVTGISAKDANGQRLSKAFPRLSSEIERVREAIKTRLQQSDSKRIRKLDGETLYEDITIYPLITNGVDGAVIRLDDVTEKVRLEEMMIQSEKMLSVGGLAAGMAHEINNPLAGMIQTANVLHSRLTNIDMPANQRAAEKVGLSMGVLNSYMEDRGVLRMISSINESGQRISDIVSNMLSFARKSEEAFSSHDVSDLLDRTLELASTDYDLKKQYDFKAISVVKEYADNLPSVGCNSAPIQQVVLNILRNGAQSMHDSGTQNPQFILRTWLDESRGMVCIAIQDNGPGMVEAVRKRVFDPFFTTKPEGVGTGLGMSVSYFIITENHSGELSVESEPGRGALFTIRLPVEGPRET